MTDPDLTATAPAMATTPQTDVDGPASATAASSGLIAAGGGRIDRILADLLPKFSRTRIKALIEAGHVTAGGVTILEPAFRVKPGEHLGVAIPPPSAGRLEPQKMDLVIVHEDQELLVIDKPAGLVVHPAAGNPDGTLVNALLAHCGNNLSTLGGAIRPGIVHRLDKGTSGLMVVAKSDAAHAALKEQFQDRTLSRTYLAVVRGIPWPRQGEIDAPIGRSETNRRKMAISETGRPALTQYRVVQTFGEKASLVECRLATGRTHQIRVHLASMGHGVLGDPLYGRGAGRNTRPELAPGRQALHATKLQFKHPATSELVSFESVIPNDIRDLVSNLE